MDYKQKISEAVLGVAVGDAVGVPVEFIPPEPFKAHPVEDMLGGEGSSHGQPIGTWSDDTSMTLALADALNGDKNRPEYQHVMENFEKWLTGENYLPFSEVFDVGRTCFTAVGNFARNDYIPYECGPRGEYDCGNGALMRIIPLLFREYKIYGKDFINNPDARDEIAKFTSLTHGHERCILANEIYLAIAGEILEGKNKKIAVNTGLSRVISCFEADSRFSSYLDDYRGLTDINENLVKSSGYVVDTLFAAIWSFLTTDSYEECILKAVNLGNDTDTTAAVAGGLAGLYYGLGGKAGIPFKWLDKLVKLDYIVGICTSMAMRLEEKIETTTC